MHYLNRIFKTTNGEVSLLCLAEWLAGAGKQIAKLKKLGTQTPKQVACLSKWRRKFCLKVYDMEMSSFRRRHNKPVSQLKDGLWFGAPQSGAESGLKFESGRILAGCLAGSGALLRRQVSCSIIRLLEWEIMSFCSKSIIEASRARTRLRRQVGGVPLASVSAFKRP